MKSFFQKTTHPSRSLYYSSDLIENIELHLALSRKRCEVYVHIHVHCNISHFLFLITVYIVIATNNVMSFFINVFCRLSGFENSLFGWKSRLYPTVKKLIKEKQDDIEVVQFGKIALHIMQVTNFSLLLCTLKLVNVSIKDFLDDL